MLGSFSHRPWQHINRCASRTSAVLTFSVLVTVLGVFASAPALAASTPGWSTPQAVDAGFVTYLDLVSCPTTTFCMAVGAHVDEEGAAVNEALSWNGTTWSAPQPIGEPADQVLSLACPSTTFCVATDDGYQVMTYNGSSWSPPSLAPLHAGLNTGLGAVSCPTITFCMAVDYEGYYLTLENSSWSTPKLFDAGNNVRSVSCASASFCVATDDSGNAFTWGGASWSGAVPITREGGTDAVSCPTEAFCAVLENFTSDFTRFNGSSWSTPASIDANSFDGYADPISCAASTFCVAVDEAGDALEYNGSTWTTPTPIDPSGGGFGSVSCPTTSFCMAVDDTGSALTYEPPTVSPPIFAPPAAPPTITGISPASGSIQGGNTVTIEGTGLTSATEVDFGSGSPSRFHVTGAGKIEATVPAGWNTAHLSWGGLPLPSGGVQVTVSNGSATSGSCASVYLLCSSAYTYTDSSLVLKLAAGEPTAGTPEAIALNQEEVSEWGDALLKALQSQGYTTTKTQLAIAGVTETCLVNCGAVARADLLFGAFEALPALLTDASDFDDLGAWGAGLELASGVAQQQFTPSPLDVVNDAAGSVLYAVNQAGVNVMNTSAYWCKSGSCTAKSDRVNGLPWVEFGIVSPPPESYLVITVHNLNITPGANVNVSTLAAQTAGKYQIAGAGLPNWQQCEAEQGGTCIEEESVCSLASEGIASLTGDLVAPNGQSDTTDTLTLPSACSSSGALAPAEIAKPTVGRDGSITFNLRFAAAGDAVLTANVRDGSNVSTAAIGAEARGCAHGSARAGQKRCVPSRSLLYGVARFNATRPGRYKITVKPTDKVMVALREGKTLDVTATLVFTPTGTKKHLTRTLAMKVHLAGASGAHHSSGQSKRRHYA